MSTQTIPTPTYEEASAYILPYDKFKGKTLAQAFEANPGYVRWLARQMNPRNKTGQQIKAMANAFLAGKNGAAKTQTKSPAPKPVAATPKPAPSANGDQKNGEHPRIFSLVTNKAILHLEDALAIGKVRIFMVAYVKGKGAHATVAHYMDVDDVRVLAADLTTGRLPERYVEYKGSPKGRDGQPLSRVLKVDDRGDQAKKRPIVIQAANGPGQLVGEGAIKPAGKPDAEVVIFLTRWEARKLGHALQAYLQAWRTARMLKENTP